MNYIYLILILVIVAFCVVVWKLYNDKKGSEQEKVMAEKERDEYAELGKGLAEYNQKLREKKEQGKTKILEMFVTDAQVSNSEVAKILEMSSASARRYLDELENEGKIKQVGRSGKKVYYSNSLKHV